MKEIANLKISHEVDMYKCILVGSSRDNYDSNWNSGATHDSWLNYLCSIPQDELGSH
jgi:hypothetical protein